jgi:hypothetical protein
MIPLLLLPGLLLDEPLYAAQIPALAIAARVMDLTRADSLAGMAEQVLAAAPSASRCAACR